MRLIKGFLAVFALFLAIFILPNLAHAADSSPDQTMAFLSQVFDFVKTSGGPTWMAKASGVIVLVIASMKVSFLQPLWDKLGAYKALAAPMLGMIAGIMTLAMNPPFSWAGVAAYMMAGAGAVFLHEILDTVKAWPWIGPFWVSVIGMIQKATGGSQ